MWLLSLISLLGIVSLCILGTFHPRYADNIFERIGMGVGAFASWPQVEKIWTAQKVDPTCGLLPIAVFIFAIGIAVKIHGKDPKLPEIQNGRRVT